MKKIMLVVVVAALFGAVMGTGPRSETGVLRLVVPLEDMDGRSGRLRVSLLDVNDDIVGLVHKYVKVTQDYYSVPLRVSLRQDVADRDLLRVKVEFARTTRIYSLYQLEDRMAVQILGQDEFIRATPINYRIIAQNQRNNAPLKGARVRITMRQEAAERLVFEGVTDQHGSCTATFDLPLEVDEADLRFEVSSTLGTDRHDARIKIVSGDITYLVTDKPVYQPGQTIHIRSLSLRRPGMEAVRDAAVVFEVEDSRGNKVYKRQMKTDDFGVGYVQFVLADEINLGDYTIRAVLGQEKVTKTVNVKRYVLPKFRIELATDQEFYLPGQVVEGDVDAQYFFGKPVAAARVRITTHKYDIGFQPESELEGRTGEDGRYHFSYRLPDHFVGQPLEQGSALMRFDVEVIDLANHSEKISATKKIVQDRIGLAVVPEGGALRPDLVNRIYVLATYPDGTPCRARIEMRAEGRVQRGETDEYGLAEFSFTPRKARSVIEVQATDERGETAAIARTFDLNLDQDQLIMKMARGIYSVGEVVDLAFLTTRGSGRVYLDIIKNGQTILTRSIPVQDHQGRYRLNLTPELSGSVWLHAYLVTQTSDIVRDSRFLYVHAADNLLIDVRPDQAQYLPGGEAEISFTVTGQDGRPRVAALCVAVVDEAVFAVSELQPGLEKVYFKLEQELIKPRYEIHGFTPVNIVEMKAREARAENVMFSTLVPRDPFPMHYTTPQLVNDKILAGFHTKLESARQALFKAQNKYFERHQEYPASEQAVEAFIKEGLLEADDLLDPWGRPYHVTSPEPQFLYFSIASAGPDGVINTADDISETMWAEEFLLKGDVRALMAPAGAMRGTVEMAAPEAQREAPADEPRLREFFPETFIFEPALITDRNGRARIPVAVPDAITTWRITASASTRAGELGSVLGELRVFQDFFIDIDLPVALTEGDEISIPVAIYNYLPRSQQIRLVLQEEEWFETRAPAEIVREIERDGVSVVYFPIRARKIGHHSILVRAYGEVLSDAIKRPVAVLPDGKLYEEIISDRLSGKVTQTIAFPAHAIEGANWLGLKIFPGIFSQVVEGLDRLLGVPFGCFEQTTSVTYPNILILDYLRQTEQIRPETEIAAEEYISLGYQRLLTFEVGGGGFSWFGDAPANKVLTAYGLMVFNDMARVYDIDERLVERTARWLKEQQNGDGSWSPDAQYLHAESWANIQNNEILPTAYICWALAEIGERGAEVQQGLAYIRKNLDRVNNAYMLALVANAFVAAEPRSSTTAEVLKRLIGMARPDKDALYWGSDMPSITFTRGPGADIEATGLATYALIRSGQYGDIVTKALTYLIRAKDQSGVWYTTQGTIIALRSLVAALGGVSENVDGRVTVMINGQEAAVLTINKDNADLMHLVDLGGYVEPRNTIEISVTGEANFLYEITSRYYLPWEIVPRVARPSLAIDVKYDRTDLTVNDIVDVQADIRLAVPGRVEMVIVDLGIPPGFEVLTPTLDALVGKTIEKYSLTPRQIIIYLDAVSFGAPVTIDYQLQAKFPIRAKVRASRAYEYYNADEGVFERPVEMRVVL